MKTEKEFYEYFNHLYELVHSLNKKQYEELEEFLGDIEQSINGDTVVKKQFEILDKDGVISFELGKLTLAVRKEDLKKYL